MLSPKRISSRARTLMSRTTLSLFVCVLVVLAIIGCGGGNSNVARSAPVGEWGGASTNSNGGPQSPAKLQLTTSGGQMMIECQGLAQFNQPVVLDGNGHFSVTGTSVPCCTGTVVPTRFMGAVQDNLMVLTLTNTQSGTNLGTYLLTFGQDATIQNSGCPG